MPRLTFDDTPLTVDIPAANINGITIPRKAIAHTTQIEEYDKRVVLTVLVCYVGADGEIIDAADKGIQPYVRRMIADNTVLVDLATGIPVCTASEEYTQDPEGNSVLNPLLQNISYIPEYQLFRQMMKTPQIIDNIKIAKIQYAAALGRLD